MIEFVAPAHEDPALAQSPLLRGALLTLGYIVQHGPIGLTQNKALKRYFVTWAAETFNWPHYTAEDLYAVNKVLNEEDFPPLVVLHDLLVSAKLARHRKGFLHITKTGKVCYSIQATSGSPWPIISCSSSITPDTRGTATNSPEIGCCSSTSSTSRLIPA